MNIISKKNNDVLTLIVEGKMDSATAPELEEKIKSEIKQSKQFNKLIFDFKNLDYISSAGLRILLGTHKFMGSNGMEIINVNETVNEIFEVTGFSYILNIKN